MCSSLPSRGVYSESSVIETKPELGHGLEPPAELGAREGAAEALEPHQVRADQHQPEVGAVAERCAPDRLVRSLGGELRGERVGIGEGDRLARGRP